MKLSHREAVYTSVARLARRVRSGEQLASDCCPVPASISTAGAKHERANRPGSTAGDGPGRPRDGRRRKTPARVPRHARRTGQGDRRAGSGHRGAAHRDVLPRPCAAGGRAGAGEDAVDLDAGQNTWAELQPHPVHARLDAFGHHRHGSHRGRQDHRPARAAIRARADLRQRHSRRRNQPHAAQNAGGAAGGDAGAPGDGRRQTAPACRSRSSSWRRKIRSSRKAPIRCPKPSSTGSCSTSTSAIPARTRNSRSSA